MEKLIVSLSGGMKRNLEMEDSKECLLVPCREGAGFASNCIDKHHEAHEANIMI